MVTSSACPLPERETGEARALTLLSAASVAVTALLALGLTARSLRWPLVHDAPLMHYVAARLLAGAAPYRDVFDMNFPGVYVAHMLALMVFGGGDAGFRVFDLLLLGGTMAGLGVGLLSFGWVASLLAAALFWLFHVAGGPWRAGQRDLILCLPLAWMIAAALVYVRDRRARTLGWAGVSLGAAVWIKPHALLLIPLLALLASRRPEARGAARPARALAVLALGLAAPAVAMLMWLAAAGGLAPFIDIVGGYLVPLYSRLGRAPLVAALLGHELGGSLLAGLALWGLGGLLCLWWSGSADSRVAILAAGVAYGVVHFVVQGKGWAYHLYPLALFTLALGAAGLSAAVEARRRVAAVLVVGALVLMGQGLWTKGVENLDPAWIRQMHARAHAVAAALRPVVEKGGTVQVLDTTGGGVHALYLLGARQPTRFLYDFHFYHDPGEPYVRRLRSELLEGLRAAPPAAVVLFERGWPGGDYGRLAGFPVLEAWLSSNYCLAHEGNGYRIFEILSSAGGHPRPSAGHPIGSGPDPFAAGQGRGGREAGYPRSGCERAPDEMEDRTAGLAGCSPCGWGILRGAKPPSEGQDAARGDR